MSLNIKSALNWLIENKERLAVLTQRAGPALNNGIGVYLISAILFAFALLCAREVFHEANRASSADKELRTILQAEQEPLRPTSYPALAEAVLGDTRWNLCEENRQFVSQLDDIALAFDDLYNGEHTHSPQYIETINSADAGIQIHPDAGWQGDIAFPPLQLKDTDAGSPQLGPSLTDGSPLSTLHVPSTLRSIALSHGSLPRIDRAIERSQAIHSFRGFVGRPIETHQGPARTESIYFISLDGILRIYPSLETALTPHQVMHGSSYFINTLSQDTCDERRCCGGPLLRRYHSLPYLDLTGGGFVVTICYRITSQSVPEGIFCADISLPRSAYLKHLADSKIFHTTLLSTKVPKSGNKAEALFCGFEDKSCQQLTTTDTRPPEKIRDFARDWALDLYKKTSSSGAADPFVIKQEQNNSLLFAITVGTLPKNDYATAHEVAVVEVVKGNFSSWGSVVALVTSLFSLAVLVACARYTQDSGRQATLLRGLPVGVLRIDKHGRIIAANDRAEELLRRRLPRWGVTSLVHHTARNEERRSSKEQADTNQRTIIFKQLLKDQNQLYLPQPDGRLRKITYKDIEEMRSKGIASEYYAEIHVKDLGAQWFRISGTPLIRPRRDRHLFGIFEPASGIMIAQLQNQIKRDTNA
ncbi:PAS domain-containing protein [Archangium lansingense]|uniref:PAS domain-containing protein n=1 Tax=Archangium lansingense TaxID=2995310 RepID=A0ABT3ZYB8_9BACT|nr:PAS domain-containing protein [Archangium lansinium]MCY1074306.1 hypothetical protein [Archangium lansinium]